MHSSLGAPLTTARREPPAEAAEEVGDLGAAEDGGDVEAVSEDVVGLSPAAGQGRGVAEEAPDAGREIRGRVLEVDDAGPDLLVLRGTFLGKDANAVLGEDLCARSARARPGMSTASRVDASAYATDALALNRRRPSATDSITGM